MPFQHFSHQTSEKEERARKLRQNWAKKCFLSLHPNTGQRFYFQKNLFFRCKSWLQTQKTWLQICEVSFMPMKIFKTLATDYFTSHELQHMMHDLFTLCYLLLFVEFCLNFLGFSPIWHKKHRKSRFRPAFEVRRTQALVKIYNTCFSIFDSQL